MTLAQLLMAALVFLAVIPAALRNPTAAALAAQYLVVQGLWMAIHAEVSAGLLLLSDILVLGVIWSKHPLTPPPHYSLGHIWQERSWWDRGVIAGFPLCWATYVFMGSDWWCLYAISTAQMLFAIGETLSAFLSTRAARAGGNSDPSQGLHFATARGGVSG